MRLPATSSAVEHRGADDDRGAVLVVVEDRNAFMRALQPLLDLEALGRLDVLEVDAAEGRLERRDDLDELVDLVSPTSMSNTSMPAKFLNRTALPSITGFEASGPISPRPSTAVPFEITATRFWREVRFAASPDPPRSPRRRRRRRANRRAPGRADCPGGLGAWFLAFPGRGWGGWKTPPLSSPARCSPPFSPPHLFFVPFPSRGAGARPCAWTRGSRSTPPGVGGSMLMRIRHRLKNWRNPHNQTQLHLSREPPASCGTSASSPMVGPRCASRKPRGISIGRFCSFADRVEILLGGNHRVDWVSTYPFSAQRRFGPAPRTQDYHGSGGDVSIGHDVWSHPGPSSSPVSASATARSSPPARSCQGCAALRDRGRQPAAVIRYRFDEATIAPLLEVAWWDLPPHEIVAADTASSEREHCRTRRSRQGAAGTAIMKVPSGTADRWSFLDPSGCRRLDRLERPAAEGVSLERERRFLDQEPRQRASPEGQKQRRRQAAEGAARWEEGVQGLLDGPAVEITAVGKIGVRVGKDAHDDRREGEPQDRVGGARRVASCTGKCRRPSTPAARSATTNPESRASTPGTARPRGRRSGAGAGRLDSFRGMRTKEVEPRHREREPGHQDHRRCLRPQEPRRPKGRRRRSTAPRISASTRSPSGNGTGSLRIRPAARCCF